MATNSVDAGTTVFLTVNLLDKVGIAAITTAVFAAVRRLSPNTPIRAETALAGPASTMQITVTNTENLLVNPNSSTETQRVTLRAQYGIGDEIVSHFDYTLKKGN